MGVKRIDKLTDAHKARFPEWVEKYGKIVLSCDDIDWDKTEHAIRNLYRIAKLKSDVRMIRVPSPLVGALACCFAAALWNLRDWLEVEKTKGGKRPAPGGALAGLFENSFLPIFQEFAENPPADILNEISAVVQKVDRSAEKIVKNLPKFGKGLAKPYSDLVEAALWDGIVSKIPVDRDSPAPKTTTSVSLAQAMSAFMTRNPKTAPAVPADLTPALARLASSLFCLDAIETATKLAVKAAITDPEVVDEVAADIIAAACQAVLGMTPEQVRTQALDMKHKRVLLTRTLVNGLEPNAVARLTAEPLRLAQHSIDAVDFAVIDEIESMDIPTRLDLRGPLSAAAQAVSRVVDTKLATITKALDEYKQVLVEAMLKHCKSWNSYYSGGNQWISSVAHLTFLRDVCDLELDQEENFAHYEMAAVHGGPRFMHREFCLVSDRPLAINTVMRNNQPVPHCEDGPSHAWKGGWQKGWQLWFWFGVQVPKVVILNPETQTLDEIQNEPNQEVKRIRINRYGWRRYLEQVEAEVVDERTNPIDAISETLMSTKDGYKVLVCACPSTGRVYPLEVADSIETCEDAQHWLSGGLAERSIGSS